jgi:hypothetical protein
LESYLSSTNALQNELNRNSTVCVTWFDKLQQKNVSNDAFFAPNDDLNEVLSDEDLYFAEVEPDSEEEVEPEQEIISPLEELSSGMSYP